MSDTSEEIKRGSVNLKLSWKKDKARREALLQGDYSETEIVRIFSMLVSTSRPECTWLDGYAAGRQEGVNATRLEYAMKQKGGKK